MIGLLHIDEQIKILFNKVYSINKALKNKYQK